jgi:hypothetical protein
MAYQRKPKKATKESADSYEFADEEVPSVKRETPQSAFASDFQNMHPGLNTQPRSAGVQGDKNAIGKTSIESIVSTLAHLQFTTKGRIDENGKFELIFCSPEPVVTEVRPVLPPPEPYRYLEGEFSGGHKRKRSGHKSRRKPWLLT